MDGATQKKDKNIDNQSIITIEGNLKNISRRVHPLRHTKNNSVYSQGNTPTEVLIHLYSGV